MLFWGFIILGTLVLMLVGGIIVQGPIKFWTSLVPHGVPGWLIPIMFPLEVVGLFIKPFALMVRLGANMLGGHLVLLSYRLSVQKSP